MPRYLLSAACALLLLALLALLRGSPVEAQHRCASMAQGSCTFPRTCSTTTDDIVGCPAGYDTSYYRQEVTADNNGDWGAGNCGGGPICMNDIYLDVPDNTLYYRGFWIRMHDHNQDARVHFRFGDWSGWTLVASEDVYSSGQACEEGCDDDHPERTHPPGDQGCPDPPPIPGPTGWFTTLNPGWINRGSWPCANSFAEHSMDLNPVPDVNRVWIRFDNDNAHVHVYDYILTACTVAVPSLNVGASCAGGTQRTVTWATTPGFQYQVQAARDAAFTTGLLSSGWVAANNYTFSGLGHGLYYYHIRARDGAGRTGAWLSPPQSAEQDQTPPTTTATPSGTAGNGGWWRSNVQVSLTPADVGCSGLQSTQYRVDGGGWAAYGAPFMVSGEGSHTVEFWSRDQAGNTEATGSLVVRIDTVPPATTPSTVCSNPGGGGWCRGNVTVSLAAADATSGVASTEYRVNSGAWQTYGSPFAFFASGVYNIDYRSTDVAGNVEATGNLVVRIDTVPPATTATPSGTAGNAGWWRSNVLVNLAAVDALSGVANTWYRVDGGAWTTYSGPFTVSGEGVHTVNYYSLDVAGNMETPARTLTLRIDTVPPASSITSLSDGQWVRGTVNVAGVASDATSGVAAVAWSRDNGATWAGTGGTTSWSATWDTTAGPDGDYRLGSRADDVAGNQESPAFILVHVDNTPPATTATPSGTAGNAGWWRSDVQVSLSASDGSGIGVASTSYRVDGGAWTAYSGPFTITGEGSHTVEYRSTDGLGNQEPVRSLTVQIDTLPPTTTATPSGTAGNAGWYRSDVQVSLAASDATSGVGATFYRVDGGAWQVYGADFTVAGDGIHTVEYRSTDVAGNGETARSLTVRIDVTPPTTTPAPSGLAGNSGWWRSAVQVSLNASDATSGVDATSYRVDGGAWLGYTTPFTVAGEGTHIVAYRSTDVAGNQEPDGSLTLRIDTVPPATTATLDGPLGSNGWYTGPVTLTLTAADATSGVDETLLDGAPYAGAVRYDQDGHYQAPYFSTDVAGNQEPAHQAAFRLDLTPPLGTVTGGAFCPGCGERLLIRATGADGMSGVCAWRLEVRDRATALRSWSGSGAPVTVVWDGRDTAGRRVAVGFYALALRVTDCAGWRTEAAGQAQVTATPPPPPPTATPLPPAMATPAPSATPTPEITALPPAARTRTPTPTGTPRPGATPTAPAPTSTPTPIPVAQVPPAPPARGIVLRLLVFEDHDADAVRVPGEPGLKALRVVVEGVGEYVTDASGVITVTLPGAGEYTFVLADRPGPTWRATTRERLTVRVGEDGSLALLPGRGKALPVGVAEGVAFAFGLVARRMTLWLALTTAGLLFIVALTAVLDQRAKALRRLERAMKVSEERISGC